MKNKIISRRRGVDGAISIALVIGLIFMTIGVLILVHELKFWPKATETTGGLIREITTTTSDTESGTTTNYYAQVYYVISGVEYTKKVSCSRSDRVGDVLELHYIPGNPHDVRTGKAGYGNGVIVMFFGGLAFLVFVNGMKNRGVSNRKIIRKGTAFSATVSRAEKNMNVTIKSRNPQYLICEATHPATGKPGEFETDSVMADLSRYIGRSVKVYLLDEEYYVDLKGLIDDA